MLSTSNQLPKRKVPRLPGINYSDEGYYFVTICAFKRQWLFGRVVENTNGALIDSLPLGEAPIVGAEPQRGPLSGRAVPAKQMALNNIGNIVDLTIKSLPDHHAVTLDNYQIMPNHVHVIFNLEDNRVFIDRSGRARSAPTIGSERFQKVVSGSLSCIVRSFKSECTKQARLLLNDPNLCLWQRNYYEHIVRDDESLWKIGEYIKSNPERWDKDQDNPENLWM